MNEFSGNLSGMYQSPFREYPKLPIAQEDPKQKSNTAGFVVGVLATLIIIGALLGMYYFVSYVGDGAFKSQIFQEVGDTNINVTNKYDNNFENIAEITAQIVIENINVICTEGGCSQNATS